MSGVRRHRNRNHAVVSINSYARAGYRNLERRWGTRASLTPPDTWFSRARARSLSLSLSLSLKLLRVIDTYSSASNFFAFFLNWNSSFKWCSCDPAHMESTTTPRLFRNRNAPLGLKKETKPQKVLNRSHVLHKCFVVGQQRNTESKRGDSDNYIT